MSPQHEYINRHAMLTSSRNFAYVKATRIYDSQMQARDVTSKDNEKSLRASIIREQFLGIKSVNNTHHNARTLI
jgi:hypothetical protein